MYALLTPIVFGLVVLHYCLIRVLKLSCAFVLLKLLNSHMYLLVHRWCMTTVEEFIYLQDCVTLLFIQEFYDCVTLLFITSAFFIHVVFMT